MAGNVDKAILDSTEQVQTSREIMDGQAARAQDTETSKDVSQVVADNLVERWEEEYVPFRNSVTETWMEIYYNYIGVYKDGVLPKDEEWRTKIFMKATKIKVLAAWSQMIQNLMNTTQLVNCEALDGNHAAAAGMQGEINSQLEIANIKEKLKICGLDDILYGNCYLQAPVKESENTVTWTADKMSQVLSTVLRKPDLVKWKAEVTPRDVLQIYNRNVFEMYPHPYTQGGPQSGEGVYHAAIISKHDLRDLRDKQGFDKTKIDKLLSAGEDSIEDDAQQRKHTARGYTDSTQQRKGYQLLFFSGQHDSEPLRSLGVNGFDKLYGYHEAMSWVIAHSSGNVLIKTAKSPLITIKRPFFSSQYERVPYESFGVGIGENMMDPQELINGALRLFIDAKKLALPQLGINKSRLAPGQKLRFGLAKVWQVTTGNPKDFIYPFSLTDVSDGLLNLIEIADKIADEMSGFPKWTTRGNQEHYTKTASGLGMLMNAQSQLLRGAIENFDDDLLEPIGKAFYEYNMLYHPNSNIKGNMRISANGLSALMEKDKMNTNLMQMLSYIINPVVVQNPNAVKLLRMVGGNMGIRNVDSILPSDDQLKQFADMKKAEALRQMQGVSQPNAPAQPAQGVA